MNLNVSETKCETSELRFKSGVKRNSKECFKLGEVKNRLIFRYNEMRRLCEW